MTEDQLVGAFGVANGLTLLGWLGLGLDRVRRRPADRPAAAVVALATLAVLAAWVAVDPLSIPVDWVTVLHEGDTLESIRQLEGHGAHAGPNYLQFFQHAMAWGTEPHLRTVVRNNLLLHLLNGALIGVGTARIGRSWRLGGLLALVWWLSPGPMNAAASELPVQLLSTQGLLMLLPVAVLRESSVGRGRRALAWGVWIALTGLVAATRTEVAGLALVPMGVWIARAVLGDPRLEGWGERIRDGLARLLARRRLAAVLALVILVGGYFLIRWSWGGRFENPWHPRPIYQGLASTGRPFWFVLGLHPLNPSFLTLPPFLAASLPIGVPVLFVVGTLAAIRHPLRTLALPLPVLILYRIYHVAGHQAIYEMYRYVMMLDAPILLVAAIGWRALAPRARPLAALLLLVPPIPELGGRVFPGERGDGLDEVLPRFGLLAQDAQREVRELITVLDEHPDCIVITRSKRWGQALERDIPDEYVFFTDAAHCGRQTRHGHLQVVGGEDGRALSEILTGLRDDPLFEALMQVQLERGWKRRPGEAPDYHLACVLFYRGLDCNKRDRTGCEAELEGMTPIWEEVRPPRPYNTDFHKRATTEDVRIGLYEWPLDPP